ncbi:MULTISPECIES: DotA/TraY family protein [Devosia]|uniref:DotA/TraY family protein n=1 Tax=Devosia TaxID=46913 RepID=UPI001300B00A|nr:MULTISPECIES: DotA/TraY family protein [Devosia]
MPDFGLDTDPTSDLQSSVIEAFQASDGESLSTQMAAQIFGPLFGAGPTLLSMCVGYLNVAMLALGGMLFFYNVAVGVLQTSHEGVVLGRRWSSLWAPLRLIFAIGLLVPMPNAGGYNSVQAGIAWLVRGSTSAASLIWSSAVPALIAGDVQVVATKPAVPTTAVADIWKMSACKALANFQLDAAGSDARISFVRAGHQNGAIALVSRIAGREDITTGICGSIATPLAPSHLSAPEASLFMTAHLNALASILAVTDELAARALAASIAHDGTAVEMAAPLRAAIIRANNLLLPIAELVKSSGGDEGQQRLRAYLENRDGQGWLAAGSFYLVLANLNHQASSVLSARPTILTPARYAFESTGATLDSVATGRSIGWFGSANGNNLRLDQEELLRVGGDMDRAFSRASAALASFGFALPDPALAAALSPAQGEGGSIWDVLGSAVNEVGQKLAQQVALYFAPENTGADPVVGLIELGQFLIATASSILSALAMGSAVPVVGGAVGAVMAVVGPLLLTMTVAGGAMSVLLPTVPFILWILAVFGYFMAVVVAVVAAPLWAVAHMRLDGEGLAPEAAHQGFLLLLRLLLTPTLMILGFFAAMAIFRAVSGMVGAGIYYLISSFSGHPMFWLAAIAVMAVLTVSAFLLVLERSFSLVTKLPDAVCRWIGAPSSTED